MSVAEAVEPVAAGSQAHSTVLRQSTMVKDQTSRIRCKGDESLNISSILNESWMTRTRHAVDMSTGQTLLEADEGSNWEETLALLDEAHYQVMCEVGEGGGAARVAAGALELARACRRALHAQPVWRRSRPPHAALLQQAASWQLLHALAADSCLVERASSLVHVQPSPHELALAVEREDSALRLLRVLVCWLEESAAAQEALLRPEGAGAGVVGAPGFEAGAPWANTTHHLLLGDSLFAGEGGARLVRCVDPDAPRRQQRRLHPDDQQDDDHLCRRIFKEIRCGRLDAAVATCLAAGQPWRAALLQGCRAAHYGRSGTGGAHLTGNPALELWRWSCGELARADVDSVYMRAALGVLSGRAGGGAAVAAVCAPCWEDLVWAACSAALRQHTALALREDARAPPPGLASRAPAPPASDEPPPLSALLDAAAALMDGAPLSVYQRCQRHLALGELGALHELAAEHADTDAPGDDGLVRFLAHVVLLVRGLGAGGRGAVEGDGAALCVERYGRQCAARAASAAGLQAAAPRLALYCAACPPCRARELWPDVLERASTPAERRALAAAGAAHAHALDAAAAVRELVARATRSTRPDGEAAEAALAWVALASGEAALGLSAQEALALGVQLVRAHVGAGALEAGARALRALQPLSAAASSAAPDCDALRHYLSWRAYVEALEAFGAWQRHRAQQPAAALLPAPSPALEAAGRERGAQSALAARVQAEARAESARGAQERRAESERQLWRRAHRRLRALLQFPGGWLQGGDEAVRRACLGEAARLAAALEYDEGGAACEGGSLVALVGGAARRLHAALDRRTLRLLLGAAARHHLAAARARRDPFLPLPT